MFIEKNSRAFQIPTTVAGIFEENINKILSARHLQCYVEPTFQQAEFWDIVRRYEGKITVADFELISPNMPGISAALTVDLKKIHTVINSAKTNLKFQSPDDNTLSLNEADDFTRGLVNYASEGGGNITLKIRNLKRHVSTKSTVTEITIAEVEIVGKNGAEILAAFQNLI